MASDVEICNRALQKLGATLITSLAQDSANARACATAYVSVRQAVLRAHPWNFAIKRFQLAASGTAPTFGPANAFPVPAGFLKLLQNDVNRNFNDDDRQVEGTQILTNESAPLNIRCIVDVTDPNQMDPLFREAFSTKLAFELCEQITQSNTKKAALKDDYKDDIKEARRNNALENTAAEPPVDTYLTVRL